MKACVLKEKNENELLNDREKLVKELHDLKLKKVIGVVENPIKIRLIKRDIKYLDYVIVHELSHLIHKNHSKEFWKLVEENKPDYKIIRKEMRE